MRRWIVGTAGGLALCASALANAQKIELSLPRAELLREHGQVRIALPGGRELSFATEARRYSHGTGVYGRSAQGDRLIAFVTDDAMSARIYVGGGVYRSERSAGLEVLAQVLPPAPDFTEPPRRADTGRRAPLAQAPIARAVDGVYPIDVLVLYTERYAALFPGDTAVALIEDMLFKANAYFRTSAMPLQYRLVAAQPYVASRVYDYPDFGDEPGVAARRNAAGADLVVMLEGGLCEGQSQTFNGSTATADGAEPTNVDPERDAFVFLSVKPDCFANDWLLAHELGHALGGGHDHEWAGLQAAQALPDNQLAGDGYWKEYAHGVRCGNAGAGGAFKYASIMAYGLETTRRGTDLRGDFFSSPDFVQDGEACGAAGIEGIEPTRADNARSISLAAPYVSAYREPVTARSATQDWGGASDAGLIALLLACVLRRGRQGTAHG